MRCDDAGTICEADTYDQERSNGVTATGTAGTDNAVAANSEVIPRDSSNETFGYTLGTEEGKVQVRAAEGTSQPTIVRDPQTRQWVPVADRGSFELPSNASTGIHRHIEGVTRGMDTEPGLNGGWGDSQLLGGSNPRPMYVIHGTRVGVRELVNGRLQFRMVRGAMDSMERNLVLGDLNREQLKFRRR
jgi:hypothetical protein